MENMMAYINIGTSVMLSVILFMAGVAKISDLVYTEQIIRKFAFLPKEIAPLIKVSLPVVEITIAIALLFPFSAAYATLASATLFAMFVIVLTIAFFQDKDTPCGCFGASSQERITGLTIGRAGLLFSASILLHLSYLDPLSWVTIGSFLFALLGCCLILWTLLISSKTNAINTDTVARGRQFLSRRDAIKIIVAIIAGVLLQSTKSISALACCRCEYQRHYDPPTNCCTSNPPNYTHKHHYWRRCYNICTGQRGGWHKIQPDSCQCECGTCSDSTWVQNECCFASECCCNMGICECGCPC